MRIGCGAEEILHRNIETPFDSIHIRANMYFHVYLGRAEWSKRF